MFINPRSSAAWRSTFQWLRQDFQHAADAHFGLRHVVLQALDEEGTIPPSLKRVMRTGGGFSAGEMRARQDLPPPGVPILGEEEPDPHLEEMLRMNSHAEVGYLYGPQAARENFERLAERAWLALPGTPHGKAQAFPQPRPVERWMAFVYSTLRDHPGSYLEAADELYVCWKSRDGRRQESQFPPVQVERETPQGTKVGLGYPEADTLPGPVKRWKFFALAADPSTASAVAIDMLLAHPDPEGPYLLSWQELDDYQRSPEFQNANRLLDEITLGEGRRFPIRRYWCKPAPGPTPSICPNADPPAEDADRKALLVYLPRIAKRFRELHLIGEQQTIHWVGRQASLGTVCRCHLTSGESKPEAGQESEDGVERSPTADPLPSLPVLDSRLYAIHYSQELQANSAAQTPPVSAIIVQHVLTGQQQTFAAFQVAEQRGISPADFLVHLPELEKQVLGEFFDFVARTLTAVWLHWAMRQARFGFEVLAQRARLHGLVPGEIPPEQRFDLSTHLKRRFGEDYVPHPRFWNALELNGKLSPDLMNEAAAATAWARGEYARLIVSLSRKVDAIADLFDRARKGTFKTVPSALKDPNQASASHQGKPLHPARHSADFRSVHWYGDNYTFSPTQAACVKVLWMAWENGTPELGQETILEHPEVEAESKRLVDVFKGHPAWSRMIVKGNTAGAYRLTASPEPR